MRGLSRAHTSLSPFERRRRNVPTHGTHMSKKVDREGARLSWDRLTAPCLRQGLGFTRGHAVPALRAVLVRCRAPGQDVARAAAGARPGLVLGRPARREPGPHRPHGRDAEAALLGSAHAARLQGGGGRLPGRLAAGLRLHTPADRGGPRPGRRLDPGAHAESRGADRAHDREHQGREARNRPPLQLDVGAAAARCLPAGSRRHRRHRHERREAVPASARRASRVRRSGSSTRRRASPAPRWTSRSRSASPSWTSGSHGPTGRRSSTCPQRSR